MKARTYKLTTFLVVLSLFSIDSVSAQAVNVPDANLAAIIRRGFNLGPNQDITVEALSNIRGLSLVDKQIRNLTGLQYATNLERIVFGSNQVSDIRPTFWIDKTHALVP